MAVRLAYNVDHPGPIPVPPPPEAVPDTIEALDFPTRAIPGVPDLMHHKYVVRDRAAVLTGSTNWTEDSWSRQENVIVTVASPAIAAAYGEDFEQVWAKQRVLGSGRVDPAASAADEATVRPWFCPRRGERLTHRIARRIGCARRRVRVASPVITSGPILGTLAEVASDGRVDLAGAVDLTQIEEVLAQWRENGNAPWKTPALRTVLTRAPFAGKRSTQWRPGSLHDFMHAKVVVADDTVFVGSFNLSHSGEQNAENVLEIEDARLANTLAAYVDAIRGRYPAVTL